MSNLRADVISSCFASASKRLRLIGRSEFVEIKVATGDKSHSSTLRGPTSVAGNQRLSLRFELPAKLCIGVPHI